MSKLTFGVIGTSKKENERRVPIHPEHLPRIPEQIRRQLIFEEGYGAPFGIADSEIATQTGGIATRHELLANMGSVIISKPDIITLDIKMAGTDGIEFMRKLKEEESEIPVVLCSAYGVYKSDFRTWAADAYVVKSADLTELKTIIEQLIGDKSPDLASV